MFSGMFSDPSENTSKTFFENIENMPKTPMKTMRKHPEKRNEPLPKTYFSPPYRMKCPSGRSSALSSEVKKNAAPHRTPTAIPWTTRLPPERTVPYGVGELHEVVFEPPGWQGQGTTVVLGIPRGRVAPRLCCRREAGCDDQPSDQEHKRQTLDPLRLQTGDRIQRRLCCFCAIALSRPR